MSFDRTMSRSIIPAIRHTSTASPRLAAASRQPLLSFPLGPIFPDSYRAVHTSPEEAVRGFVEVGARWMVPMHYGTFRLGREPMDEPLRRLRAEADRLGIGSKVRVLGEGETLRL